MITILLVLGILNMPIIGPFIDLLTNPAREVYNLVVKSIKAHGSKKVLLLGDSVCRQVFGRDDSPDTLQMCENQSYEIAGNYLLLKNLLEHENSFDTLILYFNPFSLTNEIDQVFTYNYFIKPFNPYLDKLDTEDVSYIRNTFPESSSFHFLPMIKYRFSEWQISSVGEHQIISARSLKYLERIEALCKQNDITFLFRTMPIKTSRKSEVETIALNSQAIVQDHDILKSYFEHITYLPDSLYLDNTHFLRPKEILSQIKR